jgi:NlpE N-terminal domain
MKQLKFVFAVPLLFFLVTNSCSQTNTPAGSSVRGIFVASTPCSNGTRPLPDIPVNADCELIKWNLTLYHDESKKTPTTYKLSCLYGLPEQGTTGLIGGGKKIEMEGKWAIIKGTGSNPNAIIYRLIDNKTTKTISFLHLSADLLHLLDADQRLMIGSAAWSYTLNRISIK